MWQSIWVSGPVNALGRLKVLACISPQSEKIIATMNTDGKWMFMIMWKGSDEADMIPTKLANAKCSEVLLYRHITSVIPNRGGCGTIG
jgi:hypothetical protein